MKIYTQIRNTKTLILRLQRLWKIQVDFRIKQMGFNYYLVHNLIEEDRKQLVTVRPWKLRVSPILIRSWSPNFSAEMEANEKVTTMWININYHPIEYQSLAIMHKNWGLFRDNPCCPGKKWWSSCTPSTYLCESRSKH